MEMCLSAVCISDISSLATSVRNVKTNRQQSKLMYMNMREVLGRSSRWEALLWITQRVNKCAAGCFFKSTLSPDRREWRSQYNLTLSHPKATALKSRYVLRDRRRILRFIPNSSEWKNPYMAGFIGATQNYGSESQELWEVQQIWRTERTFIMKHFGMCALSS